MGSSLPSFAEIPLSNLRGTSKPKKSHATVTVVSLPAEEAESFSITPSHDGETREPTIIGLPASLPPVDGGRQAWMFLMGCFFFEALIWGFPFSFGVFETYYSTHLPYSQASSGIAIIGTCATGIMYLFAPVSLYFLEAYPSLRRLSSVFGLVLSLSALLASSFLTRVWQLILTQGILYAIGGSLLYAPTNIYLSEWFIKKQGLAIGVMWSGVGVSGLIFPYLLSWLLRSYGAATTLRIWALILFIFASPLIYFIRPRLPMPARRRRARVHQGFLFTRTFWILQMANTAEGLGFFMPSIYLPSYARSLHMSINGNASLPGEILLSVINSLSALSAPLFGHLCDRFSVYTVLLVSTAGSSLAVFLLWLPAPRAPLPFPLLVCFACAYGLFAGGWSAVWSGFISEIQRVHPRAGLGSLMGLLSAGRGIGAVCSGPVSGLLLSRRSLATPLGGSFANVVLFTGVTALLGGLGAVLVWCREEDGRVQEEGDEEEVVVRDME